MSRYGIGFVGGQPPFITGQVINPSLTVKNPTGEVMAYAMSLYLGSVLIGTFSATVQPGQTQDVGPATGTAPSQAGVYPAILKVTANGESLDDMNLGNVQVNSPAPEAPDIQIVSLTWL